MHLLMALLGAAGVISLILWRPHTAATAARELAEMAGETRGLFRRWSMQRWSALHPLSTVDDPRTAATALMAAVAQSDGAMTDSEQRCIIAEIEKHFAPTPRAAQELVAQARFLTRDIADPLKAGAMLKPLLIATTSPAERRELIGMLSAVATANERAGDIERQAIGAMQQSFLSGCTHNANIYSSNQPIGLIRVHSQFSGCIATVTI